MKQGFPESKTPWIEIVGVVHDVKTQAIDQPVDMQAYLPMTQRPAPFGSVVVRSSCSPTASLSKKVPSTKSSTIRRTPTHNNY